MKLLNFFKKENSKETKKFSPIELWTENVNETLLEISKDYNIALSTLDFKLIEYKTFIKIDNEFVEVEKEHLDSINNEKFLRDESHLIKQKYKIVVKRYEINDYVDLVGKMEIGINYLYAKYHIYPDSTILYSPMTQQILYQEILKKKIRNNLLIGLFEEHLNELVERVISKVRVLGELEDIEVIELCKGIEPVNQIDEKIIYHYIKRKESVKKEFVYPVRKGDVLIEIIKPKEGKNGRGCNGEIIKIPKPKSAIIPEFSIDDKSIQKEEDDSKIVFVALKNGYLYKEDDKFFIKDEISVKSINIKTGDIIDGKESDIKLEVNEKSALKEAIGNNTLVESTIVRVKGNVGSKAKIFAKDVKIEGQTHKKSIIEADEVDVNIHKGYIKALRANINILENGTIVADEVNINQAVGGNIISKKVFIKLVGSHIKIEALNLIEIDKLVGSENKFIISAKILDEKRSITKIEEKIKKLKIEKERMLREYNKRLQTLDKNKKAYEELKSIYIQNKKNSIKTSPTIIKKLKEFQSYKDKTKALANKIKDLQEELMLLEEEVNFSQKYLFNAKIISHTPWSAYNRIEFDLIEPPIKISYDTKGNEGVCGFKIRDFGDEFKIVKIKVEK